MSTSTKVFVALYGAWLLGFVWLNITSLPISEDFRTLYFVVPFAAPFALIGLLSIIVKIGEIFGKRL